MKSEEEDEHKKTLEKQVTYWQSQAMQLQSERDQLVKKLGKTQRMLERYGLAFGFRTPTIPSDLEPHEPFSQ